MESVRKVLADISCSEGETNAALEALAEFYCIDVHEDVRKFVFTSGIAKRLVGILRSSSRPSSLTTAARCLALIAYDDQEAKTYFARLEAIPLFLATCEPLSSIAALVNMEEERISLYEEALGAIRTLTFQNSDNQRLFRDNGGTKRLVAIHNSCLSSEHATYRAKAAGKLAALVLGNKMICRAAQMLKGSRLHSDTVRAFAALSKHVAAIGTQYPAYLVDLADGGQRWVADQMIQANVVLGTPLEWPDQSAVKWTCVRVTAVEDGGHLWCQFLTKEVQPRVTKMAESLQSMPPPGFQGPDSLPGITVGSSYAMYYDPAVCGQRGCLAEPQWCRGRLLQEGDKWGRVCVLAVDYGIMVRLPASHLGALPQPCLGVPPQAIPCKLMGVKPLPPSFLMLENIAGIMHNIASDSSLYINDIRVFQGLGMLLELAQLPDRECVVQALGALICVSQSADIASELGRLGAVKIVLGLCGLHRSDTDLMKMVMNLLCALLLGCHMNCVLFKREGGEAFVGKLIHEVEGRDLEVLAARVFYNLSITCAKGLGRSPEQIRRLRAVNGERSLAKPVIRARLSDSEGSDEDRRRLRDVEGEEEEEVLLQHYHQHGAGVTRKVYTLWSTLPFRRDSTHEFKLLETKPLKIKLRRTICALINTGVECTIYLGISSEGVVHGVQLDRGMMDHFCFKLDGLMSDFSPSIKHDRYTVNFVPVVKSPLGTTLPPTELKAAYIIEVNLMPSIVRQFHTFRKLVGRSWFERCYYRTGCSDVKLSFHSLRQTVAQEEGERCQQELEALERSVVNMEQARQLSNDSI